MFKPRDPRVDAVAAVFRDIPKDGVLSYECVFNQFGLNPQEGEGRSICYRARERLRKEGIVFRVIRNVGFQRLDDSGIVNDTFRKKRMIGQLKREHGELSNGGVKYHDLPPQDRSKYVGRLALNSMMRAQANTRPERLAAVNPTAPGKEILEGLKKLFR